MRIFVTGASGWVGSAVVPELIRAGHQVVGLSRSEASATKLTSLGAEALQGSLEDLDALRSAAQAADGVIHLAYSQDFTQIEAAVATDRQAIDTFGDALEGTGKPFVIASGTPAVPGQLATEQDAPASFGPAAGRSINAKATLALADRGIRSAVVRIPRSVHGDGDKTGLIPRVIDIARQKGVSGYVGDGASRWPAVHVLDAATLFRLTVESAPAGSVLHAVGDEGVRVRDFAEVIGRHLGLPAESRAAEDFGFLGAVLAVDQPASSKATRELLGWNPAHQGLLADLEDTFYYTTE